MKIEASFTNSGAPALGLTPTIRIRVLPTTLVVTDESMVESGDGTYFYDYGGYDAKKDYAIRCDGGVSLSDTDRYKFAGNENYYEDIAHSVWSESVSAHMEDGSYSMLLQRMVGLQHENIYIDNPIYDGDGNLTSARVRIYSSPGSVGTTVDLIGTYQITAPSNGAGKFTTWKQVKFTYYYPTQLSIKKGSIQSGSLSYVEIDNSDRLILNEITGSDAFDYEFLFGNVTSDVRTVKLNGYYEGNPAHKIKIQAWNYNLTQWDNLTAEDNDFLTRSDDDDYSFSFDPGSDYISGNEIQLKIIHTSNGSAGHTFNIDHFCLEG